MNDNSRLVKDEAAYDYGIYVMTIYAAAAANLYGLISLEELAKIANEYRVGAPPMEYVMYTLNMPREDAHADRRECASSDQTYTTDRRKTAAGMLTLGNRSELSVEVFFLAWHFSVVHHESYPQGFYSSQQHNGIVI